MSNNYYLIKTSDFTSFANLIRSKNNTSTSISWIQGFNTAINGIKNNFENKVINHNWFSSSIYSNSTTTAIQNAVFLGCSTLTSINLPQCLTIQSGAFANCSNLTNIAIPKCTMVQNLGLFHTNISTLSLSNCISIGKSALMHCNNLSTISLPKCTTIDIEGFDDCSKLQSINLPNCTTIGKHGFARCTNLKSVTLPKLTTLGDYVFYSCPNITYMSVNMYKNITKFNFSSYHPKIQTVNFPSATIIGSSLFQNCSSLTAISIPLVTTISQYAFLGCTQLKSINLPKCTTVQAQAFSDCYNLSSINLDNCTTIAGFAFTNCSKLSVLNLQKLSTATSNTFKQITGLEYLYVPNLHNNLSAAWFSGCANLKYLYGGFSHISRAFDFYTYSYVPGHIEEIWLPDCSYIYNLTFRSCESLMKLYLLSTSVVKLANKNAFTLTPMSNSTYTGNFGSIYVPASLVNTYKTATNWATYSARIVGYEEEEPPAVEDDS